MKVRFEFDVDFIEVKGNCLCKDCHFHRGTMCIKEDKLLCGKGKNGYFVINEVEEC